MGVENRLVEERWSRIKALIGEKGFKRLSQAQVAVVGLGGVGGYAAEALARSGVGRMVLIDGDIVEESNINRQVVAFSSTVGQPKVEVMKRKIQDINPNCQVTAVFASYREGRPEFIWQEDLDYVVDAIDFLPDKIDLILRCCYNKIKIASSMGMANRLDPMNLKVADISQTRVCPLARRVRRELARHGIKSGVQVVYSEETPRKATGQTLGSVAFVTGTAGLLLAGLVVNDLLKGSLGQ